jgi:nucleotide-binding universal stress UspA family protein
MPALPTPDQIGRTMQSILLHVQDDDDLDGRIDAAVTLARAFGGHITCLHATPYAEYLTNDPFIATIFPVDFSTKMEALRLDLRKKVEMRLREAGSDWDWVHLDDEPHLALLRKAPIVDVIVLSLGSGRKAQSLAATVAATARAPVLAIPPSDTPFDPAGVVAVAWDGSAESSVALRASLPLLRKAASVHLVEIEDRTLRTYSEQGAHYLSRHGIDAHVVRRGADSGDAGGAILKVAEEVGASLLVMGAYGHSRTVEFLLGGATQAALSNSRIPLLLAH